MGLLILRSAGSAGGGGEEPGEWVGKTAHYVRQGASGTGSGNDWTNAYTTLPAALTRDHVYYIADGTYSSYVFNDATSGTLKIYIVKATASDHGTETGWDSTYGDGVANLGSQIQFTTHYWHVDGQVGGGPDSWDSGHGFKVASTVAEPLILVGTTGSGAGHADSITVRHIELQGNSNTSGGGNEAQDAVAIWSGDSFTLSHAWGHDLGRCFGFFVPAPNAIIEYTHIGSYHFTGDQHSEAFSIWNGDHGTAVTIRWSLMTHITGTGGVMFDNSEDSGTSQMRFYGNVIYHAADNGEWYENETEAPQNGILGSWSFPTEEMHNFLVYNNTFIDTEVGGELLSTFPTGTGNAARNNLFYSVGDVGYDSGIWQTTTHNHFISTTTVGTNTSTSVGDPFVDMAALNFRLGSNTTAGTDLGAPYNVDMYGNTRTTWTRGAIEFGS